MLLTLLSGALTGAEKKKAAEPYGQIGVTVFREPGFALPGAKVSLVPANSNPDGKVKGQNGVTDARGELVFRVPTTASRYNVRVASTGYVPQQKIVSIEGEQRLDATFLLAPESK